MKATKRYCCLLFSVLLTVWFYRFFLLLNPFQNATNFWSIPTESSVENQTKSILSKWSNDKKASYYKLENFLQKNQENFEDFAEDDSDSSCRMNSKCFDFDRCSIKSGIKIYIYPHDDRQTSVLFRKIIAFIKQSRYYEPNPDKGID